MSMNSTNINKTNNHLLFWFTSLEIKKKDTTTYDVGNPVPGLGQANKYGGVKPANWIHFSLLMIRSPTSIQIITKDKKQHPQIRLYSNRTHTITNIYDNIGCTRRRKAKQKHNTRCGHHYPQTNTDSVYKIWTVLQTTYNCIIPSPTKLRRDIITLPSVRPSITSLWTL